MWSDKTKFAIAALTLSCTLLIPNLAQAQENPVNSITSNEPTQVVFRAPMPYSRTFTHYETVRSVSSLGFAYIYIKANATIDSQYNRVMSVDGAWSYQADASRNFDYWEQLSLQSSKGANSVWVKATGYVHFKDPFTGLGEKKYVEIEHTWGI